MIRMRDYLREFVNLIEISMKIGWGRIVRGDGIECVLPNEKDALKVALMLKCYVKAFKPSIATRAFKKSGVRIAVGVGGLRTSDRFRGIIDGTSIYNSGRALSEMTRHTFVIATPYPKSERLLHLLFSLLEVLMDHATARQCNVLFMRLKGMTDREIAAELQISPIAVWRHLNILGWRAIAEFLKLFERLDFKTGEVYDD